MPRRQTPSRRRRVTRAGRFLAALIVVASAQVGAQVLESDITLDSELALVERAESGSYQRYSIRLTMNQGLPSLTTDKDGATNAIEISEAQALALWRDLLAEGLETIGDPAPGKMLPDQSRFTLRFRVKDKTGGFSAYGVDSLPDTRYRKIVRAILKAADGHPSGAPRQ